MRMIPTPSTKSIRDLGPVLVAGAGGMLGHDICAALSRLEIKFHKTTRMELDVTSAVSISEALKKYQPNVLINTAAYTNVDLAETERVQAELLNFRAPALLAELCEKSQVKLVHFSTDQVFEGSLERPSVETDKTNPLNYYAQTKWQGEQSVLAFPRHLVLRVQWLYGSKKDRFSPLKGKSVFTPFADQIGCPTWTQDVAEAVVALLTKEQAGLFHFAYDDFASWADVFAYVKEVWGLSVKLEPRLTADVSLPAKRPLFSVMDNAKLRAALEVESLGSWKAALLAFIRATDVV